MGIEILDQVKDVDVILVPVGVRLLYYYAIVLFH